MRIYLSSWLTDEELFEQHGSSYERMKTRIAHVLQRKLEKLVPEIWIEKYDASAAKTYYLAMVKILNGLEAKAFDDFVVGMRKAKTVEEKGVLAAIFFSQLSQH